MTGLSDQLSLIELLLPSDQEVQPEPKAEYVEPESSVDVFVPLQDSVPADDVSDVDDSADDASADDADYVPVLEPLKPVVTRSKKRKKTAEAQLAGSVVNIKIPAACNAEEEQYFVDHFLQKFERTRAANSVDLTKRAKQLAKEYGLPTPDTIRWVSNQKHQWGSCTPADGSIRISDRLAGFPTWVIDYVIVHELAHLVIIEHSPEYWDLVNAYPKTERARGYLLAKEEV